MNRFYSPLLAGILAGLILSIGCSKQDTSDSAAPTTPVSEAQPAPPAPPITESFDDQPQLSLFPRTGSDRPEDGSEAFGYWNAFIDHILRTSGVAADSDKPGNRAWTIKGIKDLESIAFFSPLAVKPETTYQVGFDFKGELPKNSRAGVGILEFDQFLWIGDQFTLAQLKEHQTGANPGVTLTASQPWRHHDFTFTTSPRTGMIHVVLFHEGALDRTKSVWFDNLSISETSR